MNALYEDSPARPQLVLNVERGAAGLSSVTLLPDGNIHSRKGLLVLDEIAGRMVVDAFNKHGVAIPIDFEHGSMAPPTGKPLPAAGWIEELAYSPGSGLIASVRWGPEARSLIRGDAYRYISPVVHFDPHTLRVQRLISAALTNFPAVGNQDALVASSRHNTTERLIMAGHNSPETPVPNPKADRPPTKDMLAKIADILGIEGEDRTLDDVLFAVLERISIATGEQANTQEGEATVATAEQKIGELAEVLRGKGWELSDGATFVDILNAAIRLAKGEEAHGADSKVAASARDVLGLSADAGSAEIVLALSLLKTDGARTVALADAKHRADARIAELVSLNVLNPNDTAEMEAAKELALSAPDRFEALLGRRAAYVTPGRTAAPSERSTRRTSVISLAVRTFQGDAALRKQTTVEAYVACELSDKGMAVLGEDELATFA